MCQTRFSRHRGVQCRAQPETSLAEKVYESVWRGKGHDRKSISSLGGGESQRNLEETRERKKSISTLGENGESKGKRLAGYSERA